MERIKHVKIGSQSRLDIYKAPTEIIGSIFCFVFFRKNIGEIILLGPSYRKKVICENTLGGFHYKNIMWIYYGSIFSLVQILFLIIIY